MAVDYHYSWDSGTIGTFTIHHEETDHWTLRLDGDFIIQTGSPGSCVTMLRDGLDNVDWRGKRRRIPNLGEWAKVRE